jgi:hypothetical protein
LTPQPGDDGPSAHAIARTPALSNRRRAASQHGPPSTHAVAVKSSDAADAERTEHAGDAADATTTTRTEHAAVDARARAGF